MSLRAQIRSMIKRANERIKWVRDSKNNRFTTQSNDLVDELLEKTGKLNNSNADRLRMGALSQEDEQLYANAVQNFLDNPLTTQHGQQAEIIDRGWESFNENRNFHVDRETYESLVDIWESDTFQKFKENFGTYANVIDEMAKNPKSYRRAINMLAGVNRSNKTNGKYANEGQLDVSAFIKRWREL